MANPPVELHVVSDATGETAQRLVQALEAQFPEQEFLEIRHPRVESISDLQLAVDRMKGSAARGGHRARRRLPHVEDAALDLPRLSRLQSGQRSARQGDRASAGALHD